MVQRLQNNVKQAKLRPNKAAVLAEIKILHEPLIMRSIDMIVIKNKAYKWILIYSDDALRAW